MANPIIKRIEDTRDALDFFENVLLPQESEKAQEIIGSFPTVYIHNWKESGDYEVYVGESNDIFKRTRQHYEASSNRSSWQYNLANKDASLYIIGHEHFNKSLTLDIENRLMHYMMSVENVRHESGCCIFHMLRMQRAVLIFFGRSGFAWTITLTKSVND